MATPTSMDWDAGYVWVVNGYLDEAGWDGDHHQIYVSTRESAEALGEAIRKRVKFRAKDGDQRFDYDVFSVSPYDFETLSNARVTGKQIADEWMDGLDL
jgi:hypothetical protein